MPRHGSTTQRGYGQQHRRLRETLRPSVERGEIDCWRCGNRIMPRDAWDLGHSDDRTEYRGPEHAACNREAARARQLAARRPTPRRRSW